MYHLIYRGILTGNGVSSLLAKILCGNDKNRGPKFVEGRWSIQYLARFFQKENKIKQLEKLSFILFYHWVEDAVVFSLS